MENLTSFIKVSKSNFKQYFGKQSIIPPKVVLIIVLKVVLFNTNMSSLEKFPSKLITWEEDKSVLQRSSRAEK